MTYRHVIVFAGAIVLATGSTVVAQLIDRTTALTSSGDGIALSLAEQIGAGRGDWFTEDSSTFIINRDPFRAIRRGRQLFQRKFTVAAGVGPVMGDGAGNIDVDRIIGAGLADSCAACHGRPRGSAGFGGDVVTRPDSRDAPHLFGLGLKEMLADEMTAELRAIRDQAIAMAIKTGRTTRLPLVAKGIRFGYISALGNGTVDVSEVEGVDPDLRIRPFFAHGETMSIREFIVGALNAEMGLQVADPDLAAADAGSSRGHAVRDGARRHEGQHRGAALRSGRARPRDRRFPRILPAELLQGRPRRDHAGRREGPALARRGSAARRAMCPISPSRGIDALPMSKRYSIPSSAISTGCSRPRAACSQ